eukprot:m.132893 g.132893  ORF g.132893 m.132893 type:complete len:1062 (+) comp13816_c0_seq3:3717-6902(+)
MALLGSADELLAEYEAGESAYLAGYVLKSHCDAASDRHIHIGVECLGPRCKQALSEDPQKEGFIQGIRWHSASPHQDGTPIDLCDACYVSYVRKADPTLPDHPDPASATSENIDLTDRTFVQFAVPTADAVRNQLLDAELVLLLVYRATHDSVRHLEKIASDDASRTQVDLVKAKMMSQSATTVFVPSFSSGVLHRETMEMAKLSLECFLDAMTGVLEAIHSEDGPGPTSLNNLVVSLFEVASDHGEKMGCCTSLRDLVHAANDLMRNIVTLLTGKVEADKGEDPYATVAELVSAMRKTAEPEGVQPKLPPDPKATDLVFHDPVSRRRYFFVSFAGPQRELALKMGYELCGRFDPPGHVGNQVFVDSETVAPGQDFEWIYRVAGQHVCGVCLIDAEFFRRPACLQELAVFEEREMPVLLVLLGPVTDSLEAARAAGLESTRVFHALEQAAQPEASRLVSGAAAAPAVHAIEEPAAVHSSTTCDPSGVTPIVGNRWHLIGYDYDLCQAEFDKLHPALQRHFELITRPGDTPIPVSYTPRRGDVPWVRIAEGCDVATVASAAFELTVDWMMEEAVPKLLAPYLTRDVYTLMTSPDAIVPIVVARRRLELLGHRLVFPHLGAGLRASPMMQMLKMMQSAVDAAAKEEALERTIVEEFKDDLGDRVLSWFQSRGEDLAGQLVFQASQRLSFERKQRFDALFIEYVQNRMHSAKLEMLQNLEKANKTLKDLLEGEMPPYNSQTATLGSGVVDFWVCGTAGSPLAQELLGRVNDTATASKFPDTTTISGVMEPRDITQRTSMVGDQGNISSVVLGVCLHNWDEAEAQLCEAVEACIDAGRCLAAFPIFGANEDKADDDPRISRFMNRRGLKWLPNALEDDAASREPGLNTNTKDVVDQLARLIAATSVQALVKGFAHKIKALERNPTTPSSWAGRDVAAGEAAAAEADNLLDEWRAFTDNKDAQLVHTFSVEFARQDVDVVLRQLKRIEIEAQVRLQRVCKETSQGSHSFDLLIPTMDCADPDVLLRGFRLKELLNGRFKAVNDNMGNLIDLAAKANAWRNMPWLAT